ncbi:hypothetical protein L596_000363 [Steinernema carpocapsae]|uniref:Uncharacterized protein n=1 Tax=Steinernema carpocapsae TaxID=34508 RepID=A0A4U8UIJ6_STECR|nr:hypothetical protein L596_000363 [Steinernema carpocapsae]
MAMVDGRWTTFSASGVIAAFERLKETVNMINLKQLTISLQADLLVAYLGFVGNGRRSVLRHLRVVNIFIEKSTRNLSRMELVKSAWEQRT